MFLIGATDEEEGGIGLATYIIKALLTKTPNTEMSGDPIICIVKSYGALKTPN